MIKSLQAYLTTGLVKSEFVNLKIRKLSADTCHEFIEWCGLMGDKSIITLGEVLYKQDLYLDFIQDNPDFAPKSKKTISRTEFYKWLISYGLFVTGSTPIEGRNNMGRWIKFKDANNLEEDEDEQGSIEF